MKRIISCLMIACTLGFVSCQKETGIEEPVTPPADSSFLPVSISFEDRKYGELLKCTFKYQQASQSIEVYADDVTTSNPYDHLLLINYYNSAGYFTKRYVYSDGALEETMQVERTPDNVIRRVTTSQNDPVEPYPSKDTFDISFYDSASFKVMKVDNIWRYMDQEIPTSKRFIFSNKNLVKIPAATFTNQQGSSVYWSGSELAYDNFARLITHTHDINYGASIMYEQAGTGMDSLYQVLGGVDGHFLDAPGYWGVFSSTVFTIFPLKLILSAGSVDLEIAIHQYGLTREVRSIPNGATMPDTEIFSFENVLNQQQRIKQTTIRNNNEVIGVWTVEYPAK